MTERTLTVRHLLAAGFKKVGEWELNDVSELTHSISLPQKAGVYAFAIKGIVQYVGLASKSLNQRLGFYRKPGPSQRTNIRLNDVIRGHLGKGRRVQVLIAHPPDFEWNGLKVSGAEGLEAGLIAEFDLPWNMRGSQPTATEGGTSVRFPSRKKRTDVAGEILGLVRRRPGMTELEIAKKLYGPSALQPQVNPHCRKLLQQRLVERRGGGGINDPFVYYPAK
jgi:hypothetical protein